MSKSQRFHFLWVWTEQQKHWFTSNNRRLGRNSALTFRFRNKSRTHRYPWWSEDWSDQFQLSWSRKLSFLKPIHFQNDDLNNLFKSFSISLISFWPVKGNREEIKAHWWWHIQIGIRNSLHREQSLCRSHSDGVFLLTFLFMCSQTLQQSVSDE